MSQAETDPPSEGDTSQPGERGEQPAPTEHNESAEQTHTTEEGEAGEQDTAEEPEAIQEPAKLIRLARMIRQLLDESREAELDGQTLGRLRAHVADTTTELGDVLSPDLRDELTRLRAGWTERSGASQAELRIEQAQLVGWLEGILQGIHNALAQEQGAAQESSSQMPGQQAQGQQAPDHHGPGHPGAGQLGGGFR